MAGDRARSGSGVSNRVSPDREGTSVYLRLASPNLRLRDESLIEEKHNQ
jgi:hypothetical protein